VPRFDPHDAEFQARREAVDALFSSWTLIGASGSVLEAQLMARAAITASLDRMIGSCVCAEEVIDLVFSRQERCLLLMVDSIAEDHGEALINKLRTHHTPPAVVLLVEDSSWLKPNSYPVNQVDGLIQTQSFGTGALIKALQSINEGQRYVDPGVTTCLQTTSWRNKPQLTPREGQVLLQLAKGSTDREIAKQMGIADSTAREYTRSILRKLNARNRTMAVTTALKQGLL
jgi:DNA-binding NarL/FixJ family response regulator